TRHEQEKQKQNRRKESAGKISSAGEELRYQRRAFRRNSGGCSGRLSITLHLLQKPLQRLDGCLQETQPLLKARNALRKLSRPSTSRARYGRTQADDCSEYRKDQQQRSEHPRDVPLLQKPHGWLQQEADNDGKD